MFKTIRINWELEKAKRNYQRVLRKNLVFKKSEEYQSLNKEEKSRESEIIHHENYEAYGEVERIKTSIFLRELSKYEIPVPSRYVDSEERDKYWTSGPYEEFEFLTEKGNFLLRNELRKEKEARRKEALFWVPIVSGFNSFFAIIAVVLSIFTFVFQQTPVLLLSNLQISEGQKRLYLYFQNVGTIGAYQIRGAYAITAHDEPEVEVASNERLIAFDRLNIQNEAFYPGLNNVTLITKKLNLKDTLIEQENFVYFSIVIEYPRLQIGPIAIGKKGFKGVFLYDKPSSQWIVSTRTHLPGYFDKIFSFIERNRPPIFKAELTAI